MWVCLCECVNLVEGVSLCVSLWSSVHQNVSVTEMTKSVWLCRSVSMCVPTEMCLSLPLRVRV